MFVSEAVVHSLTTTNPEYEPWNFAQAFSTMATQSSLLFMLHAKAGHAYLDGSCVSTRKKMKNNTRRHSLDKGKNMPQIILHSFDSNTRKQQEVPIVRFHAQAGHAYIDVR